MANNYQDITALLRSLTAFQSGNAPSSTPHDQQQASNGQPPHGQQAYEQQQFPNHQFHYEASANQQPDYGQAYTNQFHQTPATTAYTNTTFTANNSTPTTYDSAQDGYHNLSHTRMYSQFTPNAQQFNYLTFPPQNTANHVMSHPQTSAYGTSITSNPFPYATPQPYTQSETPVGLPQTTYDQQAARSLRPQTTPVQSSSAVPPAIDPRTIVTMPAALRHVARLAGRNEELGNSIRKLIANQHDNERQWWASRQALLEKQAARVEGKRKLDDVLRSVGAPVTTEPVTDDSAELAVYDMKVHRASRKMFAAMSTDLEALGIPFFGTKAELVYPANSVSTTSEAADRDFHDGKRQAQTKITNAELVKLQRKMIQHLEEMYNE